MRPTKSYFLRQALPRLTLSKKKSPIARDLKLLITNLMRKFILKDQLPKKTSGFVNLDIENQDVWKPLSKIDIGFQSEHLATTLKVKKVVSEREYKVFLQDCRKIMLTIIKKLQDKSPLKYNIVSCADCLDPNLMVQNAEMCCRHF